MRRSCLSFPATTRAFATASPLSSDSSVKGKLKTIKEVPGPPARYQIPHIGFAFHLKPFGKYDIYELPWLFAELAKKYGPIYRQDLAGQTTVIISDPEDFEKAYKVEGVHPRKNPLGIPEVYSARRNKPLGIGGLNGEEWARYRKPTQRNMLRPITVARYFPLMSEISDEFVQKLQDMKTATDIQSELMAFAIEHAAYLCFNRRFGCLTQGEASFHHLFTSWFNLFNKALISPPFYRFFRTPLYKEYERVTDAIFEVFDKETEKALVKLKEAEDTGTLDPDKDPNLLSQLLSDPALNLEDVISRSVIGLFIAGGETTASSLTFVLYQLARNQHVQEKLYADIDKHLPPDRVLTESALKKMSYVKACVKESLRYTFPMPGPMERKIVEDVAIKGFLIPKGTNICFLQNIVTTRNPDIFEDPDTFNPDRWLREDSERHGQKYAFAMQPFGFGPRSCLGQRFAEMEMHVCIAKIIQHLRVSLVDPDKEYKVIYNLFPRTTEPIAFRFTPRKMML